MPAPGDNKEVAAPNEVSGNIETIVTQCDTDEPGSIINDAAAQNELEANALLSEPFVINEEIIIISEGTDQQLQEAIEIPQAINSVDERDQTHDLSPAAPADVILVEDLMLDQSVMQEVVVEVELAEDFGSSTNDTEVAEIKASTEEIVSVTEAQQPTDVNIVLTDETAVTNNIENEAPLHIPFNISKEPVTEDSITFEPLHTSDYFASVGIKLSEEAKPVDRLGQQMKSFTEWLKTMKKIHADQFAETGSAPQSAAQTNEQHIQQLAEASNRDGEVLTEAMADVLVQQGRVTKAVEVLEKLSLLNPGKITYFAAKINQLKEL